MADNCNVFHDEFTGSDNHVFWKLCYDTNALRVAATGYIQCPGDPEKAFDADDIGLVAKQDNINAADGNETYWVLTGIGPITWKELTNETVPATVDVKVKVTTNDTTAGFLDDKLLVDNGSNSTNPLEKSVLNPAGDEDLNIRFDQSKVDHDALLNFVAGEHIDWTQSGAGTVHATNYVDNDTTDHTLLSNIGTNTHAQIDTHIADTSIHEDERVKVSSNDTTPGDLITKIQQGTNVTIVENNDGGNETITISATGDLTAECPAVQARRTTDYTFTTSYVDVTFDTTDVENDAAVVEHDNTNTDRILIKETGLYKIHYHSQTDVTSQGIFNYRVRVNDSVVIPGSMSFREDGGDTFPNGVTFLCECTAGDFISLQVQKVGGSGVLKADALLTAIKCAGAKGDAGATGAGSNVLIAEEGTNIANTPHSRLNFIGAAVTASDAGSGTTNITITGSTPVFGSEFQEASSEGESSTTSETYQQKLRLTTGSLPSGTYRIGWTAEMRSSSQDARSKFRVQLNDTTDLIEGKEEPDHANNQYIHAGFKYETLSGINNIDIDYGMDEAVYTAYIKRARLEIWRVS